MAMSVNTNMTSLIAQNQLSQSQNSLQTTIQRLSSGLRINTAADDASGYAISNRMSSIVSGLAVSVRNANDGISYSQTVSQALGTMTNNLQRMRELAVQSLNGVYSNSDKSLLAQEYNQLSAENDRIRATTTFNGANVFATNDVSFQVGFRNNLQDQVRIGSESLQNTTAVSSTMITDSPTSTEAYDLGGVINTAINAQDSSNNSTATYANVAMAVTDSIAGSSKLDNFQKTELTNLVNSLATQDQALNRGITNFGSDLNQLMGSSITSASITPQKVVNVTLGSSAYNEIQTTVSNSTAISTVLARASSQSTIAAAYNIVSGIATNPSFSTAVSTEISNDITMIYNQYKNSPNASNVTSFNTAVTNLLSGSYSSTFTGGSFNTYLSGSDESLLGADAGILSAQNNVANTTFTTIYNAVISAVNSSSLSSGIKSGFSSALTNLMNYANSSNSGMSVTDFRNAINNLRNTGSYTVSSVTTTLSSAAKAAINSTSAAPQSYLDNIISNAATSGGLSYSAIQSGVNSGISTLYNSGLISSATSSNLSSAVNTLYNQENFPSGRNMTTTQYATDLKTLMGNGATGSITPGSPSTTSFNVSAGAYSQLITIPVLKSSIVNATDAVNTIDAALTELSQQSAQQGAFQNRLTSLISSQIDYQLSQSSAMSRITDLDYSSATAEFTKDKILQSAGAAMLVQANASMKSVLKLLK